MRYLGRERRRVLLTAPSSAAWRMKGGRVDMLEDAGWTCRQWFRRNRINKEGSLLVLVCMWCGNKNDRQVNRQIHR